MGLVSFLSAKGAPGATTAALLHAALWPRDVVLVDADPQGGDVSLVLPREDGQPVDRQRGLLSLLPLARRELSGHVLLEHTQTLAGGIPLVAGLNGPEQAAAVGPLWQTLAGAFSSLPGADVLVDCGRVSSTSVHLPLLAHSDVVVAVLRADVPGVVHTRDRLAALREHLVGPYGRRPRVGVLVVAGEKDRRDVDGARALVERDLEGVEFLGHLVHDPEGARVFRGETVSRPDRTMLVRSGRPVVQNVAALVPGALDAAGPEPAERSVEAVQAASGTDVPTGDFEVPDAEVPGAEVPAGSAGVEPAAPSGRRAARQAAPARRGLLRRSGAPDAQAGTDSRGVS